MAYTLVDLPQEILGSILSLLEPQALVSFGRTCRQAYSFINPSNQLLWREAFLHVYDDPKTAWFGCERLDTIDWVKWDWHHELRSRSLAIKTLRRRWTEEADRATCEDNIKSILSIIDTAKCGPSEREAAEGRMPQIDDRSSRNLQLLTGILYDNEAALERLIFDSGEPTARLASDDLGRPQTRAMTSASRDRNRSDQCRRLHTLYGLSSRDKRERKHFYRRYVYDWTLTNEQTDFGPFQRDGSGRVNWMLLEAATVCITQAFQEVVAGQLSPPTGLWSSIPYRTYRTLPNATGQPVVDWAGVTGTWLGTYAFLDYSSLLAFNAGLVDVGFGRSFDLRDEPEVCGDLLRMELQLDHSVRTDRVLRSNVPICEDLPPLYFTGHSRGTDYPSHPRTSIKGFAALTKGGREVKWKFIIEYHGVDQWQLEGVQPGGIQSGGIFGVWSNVEHEPNSPVGPFCYFPQELCKSTSIVLAGT